RREGDPQALADLVPHGPLERLVYGAERETREGDRARGSEERRARPRDLVEQAERVVQEVERDDDEDQPEDRLDVHHPLAALRKLDGERADDEEGSAEAEGERGHGRRAERRALRLGDVGEDPREKRAGAGRGDGAARQTEDEGPDVTGAADLRET